MLQSSEHLLWTSYLRSKSSCIGDSRIRCSIPGRVLGKKSRGAESLPRILVLMQQKLFGLQAHCWVVRVTHPPVPQRASLQGCFQSNLSPAVFVLGIALIRVQDLAQGPDECEVFTELLSSLSGPSGGHPDGIWMVTLPCVLSGIAEGVFKGKISDTTAE